MKIKYGVIIDKSRCKGCALCVMACPRNVLRISERYNGKGLHPVEAVREKKCSGCGFCYIMCPDIVIEVIQKHENAKG